MRVGVFMLLLAFGSQASAEVLRKGSLVCWGERTIEGIKGSDSLIIGLEGGSLKVQLFKWSTGDAASTPVLCSGPTPARHSAWEQSDGHILR
jgi:hypothetical protein